MIYIDDWISSKKVAMMDANEELGFFRLLLNMAKETDGGLPDDDNVLATYSLLGAQWRKPTRDKLKRIGDKTSGDKIRECLFVQNGRVFNERLLREKLRFEEDRARKTERGRSGAEAMWAKKRATVDAQADATAYVQAMPPMGRDIGIDLEVLRTQMESMSKLSDEALFDLYWNLFVLAGKELNEMDKRKTLGLWLGLPRSTHEEATVDAYARISDGRWPDPLRTQFPFNHLGDKPWNRKAARRVFPQVTEGRKSKIEEAIDRA